MCHTYTSLNADAGDMASESLDSIGTRQVFLAACGSETGHSGSHFFWPAKRVDMKSFDQIFVGYPFDSMKHLRTSAASLVNRTKGYK